jgi:hypothetical protein
VTDAVRVLGAAAGLLSTCAPERCDLDGNGAVTVTDGVGVLTRAAGLHFWEYYRCPVPSETVDFSEFARFTLSREPALGYCPEIGSVLSADIARQDDGAYIARLAVAVERPLGGPDDCEFTFDPVGAPTCIGGEPQPDRTLTPDEAEGLRSAFAAVEVYEARPPICAIAVFDPCIIDHFEWDGVRADDYPCSGRRVDFTTAKALIETLNGLIVP